MPESRPIDQIKTDIATAQTERADIVARNQALTDLKTANDSTIKALVTEYEAALAAGHAEIATIKADLAEVFTAVEDAAENVADKVEGVVEDIVQEAEALFEPGVEENADETTAAAVQN